MNPRLIAVLAAGILSVGMILPGDTAGSSHSSFANLSVGSPSLTYTMPCPKPAAPQTVSMNLHFSNTGNTTKRIWVETVFLPNIGLDITPSSIPPFSFFVGDTRQIDITVPPDTPAGSYSASFDVRWSRDGSNTQVLTRDITLDVAHPLRIGLDGRTGHDFGPLPLHADPAISKIKVSEECGYRAGNATIASTAAHPVFVKVLPMDVLNVPAGQTRQFEVGVAFASSNIDLLYTRQNWTVSVAPAGGDAKQYYYSATPSFDIGEQFMAVTQALEGASVPAVEHSAGALLDLSGRLVADLESEAAAGAVPDRKDVKDTALVLSLARPLAATALARENLEKPSSPDGWRAVVPDLAVFVASLRPMVAICDDVEDPVVAAECTDAVRHMDEEAKALLKEADEGLADAGSATTPFILQQYYSNLAHLQYALGESMEGDRLMDASAAEFDAFTRDVASAESAFASADRRLAADWSMLDLGGGQRIAWHPFAALELFYLDKNVASDIERGEGHFAAAGDPVRSADGARSARSMEAIVASSWIANIMISSLYGVLAIAGVVRWGIALRRHSDVCAYERLGGFLLPTSGGSDGAEGADSWIASPQPDATVS